MALLFLGVKTETEWINDLAKTPIIGEVFLFVLMFVPAVLLSFLSQTIIPSLNNNVGFTKAMLVLLPMWNIFLWHMKVRLYLLFLPSWILLGVIAVVKAMLMIKGIDDGQ